MTYKEYIEQLAIVIINVARGRAEDNEDNFAVVYYDVFLDETYYRLEEEITLEKDFNLDLYNEILKCDEIIEVEMGGYEYSAVEIVFKEKKEK